MNVKTKLCNALRPLALGAALALTPLAQAAVVPLDKVVAIVDNDVVMQSQLDQRLNEVKQNITRRGAAAGDVLLDLVESLIELALHDHVVVDDGHDLVQRYHGSLSQGGEGERRAQGERAQGVT